MFFNLYRSVGVAALLVVFHLFLVVRTQGSNYDCKADPEIQRRLEQSAELPPLERRSFLKALLEQNPDNVFVHRAYQDAMPPFGSRRNRLIDYYNELRTKYPENAVFLYLYGRSRIYQSSDEKLEVYKTVAKLAPEFFFVHLPLALIYSRGPFQDESKARFHTEKLLQLCPSEPMAYVYVENLVDSAMRQAVSDLRHLLERTNNFKEYKILWELEFQSSAESELDPVRQRIKSDLEKMRGDNTLPVLRTRKLGYVYLSDDVQAEAIDDLIVQFHSQSEDAFKILRHRWDEEHPFPKNPGETEAYHRELLKATEKWLKIRPDDVEIWLDRLAAMKNAPATEVIATGTKLVKLLESGETGNFLYPLQMIVAEVYLERGVGLEEVPLLVESARKEMVQSGQENAQQEQFNWTANRVLAGHRIKTGLLQEAHKILEEMLSIVRLKELEASESRDKKLAATWKNEYFQLKGELAELENRPADALAFYAKANPDSQEETEKIRVLWKKIGGTEEGLAEFLRPVSHDLQTQTDFNKPLADFELTDIEGKKWRRDDLKGKALLINIWATWCTPCRWELPYIQKLYEKMKNRSDVMVLTFNIDDNPGIVDPYLKKEKFSFPVIRALDYYGSVSPSGAVPTTWFVDRNGIIRKEENGFRPNNAEDWMLKAQDYLIQLAHTPLP